MDKQMVMTFVIALGVAAACAAGSQHRRIRPQGPFSEPRQVSSESRTARAGVAAEETIMTRILIAISTVVLNFALASCATAPRPQSIEEQRWFAKAYGDADKN
jgi:hypothetical protein